MTPFATKELFKNSKKNFPPTHRHGKYLIETLSKSAIHACLTLNQKLVPEKSQ